MLFQDTLVPRTFSRCWTSAIYVEKHSMDMVLQGTVSLAVSRNQGMVWDRRTD